MTLQDLIDLRFDLGLTQEEIAKEIGLSRRAYLDIETGKAAFRRIHQLAAERVALTYEAKEKPSVASSLTGATIIAAPTVALVSASIRMSEPVLRHSR